MRSWLVATAVATMTALAIGVPLADAAPSVKPKPGGWSGQEVVAKATTPPIVTFTVGPRGKSVLNFSGEAIVKDGCTNHLQGFSSPAGPMAITNGRFRGVETSYPQRGVRVTVTGTFRTKTRAQGQIKIHFKKVAGCDATRRFTAQRASGRRTG